MENKDFKTQTEEWAKKILDENPTIKEMKEDFIEMMMFGSIGYRTDDNGNRTKLTFEELQELKREGQKQKVIGDVVDYLNSYYKNSTVSYENDCFKVYGDNAEEHEEIRSYVEELLEFSRKKK